MRMVEATNLSLQEYNEGQIGKFNTDITEYLAYVKKIEPLLVIIFGTALRDSGANKGKVHETYKGMADILSEYEEQNLNVYAEYDGTQQVINNQDNPQLKENLVKTSESLENPYLGVYYWAKGETSDIAAL